MAGYRSMNWTTAEDRARRAIAKEQILRDKKQKAVLMHADGYSVNEIAQFLDVSEGTVRNFLSVNGGY